MSYFQTGYAYGMIDQCVMALSNNAIFLEAVQVLTTQPNSPSLSRELTYGEFPRQQDIKNFIASKSKDCVFVSHAPIAMNLVSPTDKLYKYSRAVLVAEIERCEGIGIKHIVVHPGSAAGTKEEVARRLADTIKGTIIRVRGIDSPDLEPNFILNLENMVGAGSQFLSTPEDFYLTFQNIPEVFHKFVGITLDTAHAWGAGYTPDDFFLKLKSKNLHEKINVVHLNNSVSEFKSKKERHAPLAKGKIQEKEFVSFLRKLKLNMNRPIIIEEKMDSPMETSIAYTKKVFEQVEQL